MRLFNILNSVLSKNIICLMNKSNIEVLLKKKIYFSLNIILKNSILFSKSFFLFFILVVESLFFIKNKIKNYLITSNILFNKNFFLKINTNTKNEKLNSLSKVFGNSNWLERESKEFFNLNYTSKTDNRSLFLWAGFLGNPLKKNYPTIGFFEICVKYKIGLHFKKIIHV